MIVKTVTGVLAWPVHWTVSAKSESAGLLRLMCVMNGPLATASALSPSTGGWALPVGFLWVLTVMGAILLHGDSGD